MDPLQYVYLLQEREFVNNKEPVYKIGKTKQANLQRFNSYPKGSVLLLQNCCNDCNKTEKEIIKLFDTKYKKRTDRGSEYYEGNYREMTIDIYKIINYEKEIEDEKIIKNVCNNDIKANYSCDCCAYFTNIKRDYDKHNLTAKHISNKEQNKTKEIVEEEKKFCCEKCNKKYKSNVGLWKHKKVCDK